MSAELSTFSASSAVQEQVQPTVEQQDQPAVQAVDVIKESLTPTVETVVPTEIESNNSNFELSLRDDLPPEKIAPTQPQYNWKDELKKLDRKEVIAELGIDPFAVEIDQ